MSQEMLLLQRRLIDRLTQRACLCDRFGAFEK